MNKTILITGATGHIGRRLIPILLEKNYNLICTYNVKSPTTKRNKNIEWIKCNLKTSRITLSNKCKIDCVIHLCGITNGKNASDLEYFRCNEQTLLNTLESVKNKTKKFIFISSQAVYGSPNSKKIDEKFQLQPNFSSYSLSKINCEKWLEYYQSKYKGMYISLRFTGFIGGGGNIDYIINSAKTNKNIVLHSNGKVCRDYISFEYGNEIILKILTKKIINKYFCFNVSSGYVIKSYDIAKIVCDELNSKSKIKLSNTEARIKNCVLINKKIKNFIKIKKFNLKQEIINEIRKYILL